MSNTPETDQLEECDQYKVDEDYAAYAAYRRMVEHARQLERERDEWQIEALLKLAVKQLACMWCGELVDAPKGFESGTPLTEDQRGQAYREHVASCQKHPIRDVERERDRYREQADALVDRLGVTQERMIDAERQRDEVSNAFVMAVDEMVKVQSRLREAKREFDKLAEALRMITTFDYTDLQCDNGHGARSVATEALQSLTQLSPDPR
jgi:hypothetical protein